MAKELKLTQTLTGWFDVRVFNERIPRENWKIKGEDDNIAFTVTFSTTEPQAVQFVNHGKPYADANGNPRLRVTFKIGTRCRWFNENAQPVAKPSNMDLDGKQFECVIQYNELDGDPTNPKSPRGYWVNAIQFREVVTNPFAAMAGAAPVPPIPQYQQQPQQPQYQQQQPQYQQQQYQQQQPVGISAPMPPMFNDNDNLPY